MGKTALIAGGGIGGLAAAFATWIAAAGILALQIGFLVPDFVAGSKKRRPVGGIENGGPNLK